MRSELSLLLSEGLGAGLCLTRLGPPGTGERSRAFVACSIWRFFFLEVEVNVSCFSCHVVSCHLASCQVDAGHVMSWPVMSCPVLSFHDMSSRLTLLRLLASCHVLCDDPCVVCRSMGIIVHAQCTLTPQCRPPLHAPQIPRVPVLLTSEV